MSVKSTIQGGEQGDAARCLTLLPAGVVPRFRGSMKEVAGAPLGFFLPAFAAREKKNHDRQIADKVQLKSNQTGS